MARVILWGHADYTTSTEASQYLKDYLTWLLVPYVINMSWVTQYCSWAQCHGRGCHVHHDPTPIPSCTSVPEASTWCLAPYL
ncbi:hyaluronidase-2, partial [Lynx pardinus]